LKPLSSNVRPGHIIVSQNQRGAEHDEDFMTKNFPSSKYLPTGKKSKEETAGASSGTPGGGTALTVGHFLSKVITPRS